MRIPADAIIPLEKLRDYLLIPRPWDDKSKFLARAGFTQDNPDRLLAALRELVADQEAQPDGGNVYGEFLRVEGDLQGANGWKLPVVTIWLRRHLEGEVRFVTLKPRKEKKR